VEGLRCVRSDLRGVNLPEDVARLEANLANNEKRWARKQGRQLRSAAQTAVRAWEEETPLRVNPQEMMRRRRTKTRRRGK
jgi:hypothetical protein